MLVMMISDKRLTVLIIFAKWMNDLLVSLSRQSCILAVRPCYCGQLILQNAHKAVIRYPLLTKCFHKIQVSRLLSHQWLCAIPHLFIIIFLIFLSIRLISNTRIGGNDFVN